VSAPELVSYRDPLDLLRRFSPTPLKAQVPLEFANVRLETNDLSFLPSPPLVGGSVSSPAGPSCLWKIVRDGDVRHKTAEASIVMAGTLIVYSMGPACLIAADREHREILAFLGLEVDACLFQQSVLPALCRLTEFVTRRDTTPEALHRTDVAIGDRCNA
jgi:hypothetical protein